MVSQKIQEYKNYLIILIIILVILYFGRILFIPLSFSVLISFLLYPVCNWFENRKVPRTMAVLICITLLILVGAILSFLLIKQISSFSHDWPNLRSKLPDAIAEFKTFMIKLGIPITLLLNSLGLLLLGIPHPFLFGFIASVLTFIPFVGIIIGSLLPMSVAWLTYNSIWYPLGVVAVFSIVQYFEVNLIFPLAVSSRLKISSLATIISIIAGGILWGAAGMILFVPFVAILKLIADNTSKLGSLSLLLGRK